MTYDTNHYYGDLVVGYFKNRFGVDVEFCLANSGDMNFSATGGIQFIDGDGLVRKTFAEDCLIVAENTKIAGPSCATLFRNPNIKAIIKQGVQCLSKEHFATLQWGCATII